MMESESYSWRFADHGGVEFFHAVSLAGSYPRHLHDTYSIALIVAGAAANDLPGQTASAGAGSIMCIHPAEAHTGRALGDGRLEYRMLYLSTNVVESPAERASGALPSFPPVIQDSRLANAFERYHRRGNARAAALARDHAQAAFVFALRLHATTRRPIRRAARNRRAIARVTEYLHAHCADAVRLDDLVAISGLSRFHLIRCFRRATGLPPYEYLTSLRIARAKTLLAAGTAISDVADAAGFADQSHLTRVFARIAGMTPGRFARAGAARSRR